MQNDSMQTDSVRTVQAVRVQPDPVQGGTDPAGAPTGTLTRARAVLFDMDGTLVDSEGTHGRALSDVLDAIGLALPESFGHDVTGMSMQAVHRRLVDEFGLELTYAELAARKYGAFRRRSGEITERPGARAAVEAIERAGLAMAVVSNSDRILVDIGLLAGGYVRPDLVSVSRNDVRTGKPGPEGYLRAAWLLGVDPADCIVVEDSAPGAMAGVAAGMRVVAWPEPGRPDIEYPPQARRAPPDDLATTLLSMIGTG